MKFDRTKYLSLTEVTGIYDITSDEYKKLIEEKNLPIIKKKVNLGTYDVDAIYISKEEFKKLDIPKRPLK